MSPRRLYVFGITFVTATAVLYALVGFASTGDVVIKEKVPYGGPPPKTRWITRTGKDGKPEKMAQISEGTKLDGVKVPLIESHTGKQEGTLTFESARLDTSGETDRLRLEKPRIERWRVAKHGHDKGMVDLSRKTVFTSDYMLTDLGLTAGRMHGNVKVDNLYEKVWFRLTTSQLTIQFADADNRMHTDKPVTMTWGKDFRIDGVGLDAVRKSEEVTILRDARVRMIQAGGRLVLPLDPPAKEGTAQRSEILATSRGKLTLVRQDAGKLNLITMHDDCKVVRDTATLASQKLQMWITTPPQGKPGSGDAPKKKTDGGADLRKLVATDKVQLDDPKQGQGFGDRFTWIKVDEKRQKMTLSESPRIVTSQAGQMSLLSGSRPQPKEDEKDPKKADGAPTEKVVITCTGDMVFNRSTPPPAGQEPDPAAKPDTAVFHDTVVVTRTVLATPDTPLVVNAEKLTLFMARTATGGSSVRNGLAEGKVRITDPTFVTTGERCDWAVGATGAEDMVMTGSPVLLLRNTTDDQSMDMGAGAGAAKDPKAPPARADVRIASARPMRLHSPENREKTRVTFEEDVVVHRFPLDAKTGKRLSVKPASTLTSDRLRVDLVKGTGEGEQFSMQDLHATGNVAVAGDEGRATGGELRFDKAKDRMVMTKSVTLTDKDGGVYTGARMENDRKNGQVLLFGDEKTPRAQVKVPVQESPDAAKKDGPKPPQRFHWVKAPRIAYKRSEGYIKATATEFVTVLARFWPGQSGEDDFLKGDTKPGAAKKAVPWRMKTRVLEAWLDTTEPAKDPKDPKATNRGGRLKKLLASGGDVHIYSDPDPEFAKPGEKGRQAFGTTFLHDRAKQQSVLTGKGKTLARLMAETDELKSTRIEFDQKQNLMTCPTGGEARFREQVTDPGGAKRFQWVDVRCDGVLKYKRNLWVEFNRKVKLTRTEDSSTLYADWVRAILDPKTRQIMNAVATGKEVVVVQGPDTGRGKRVDWDNVSKIITLTAKPGRVHLHQRNQGRRGTADIVRFNQQTKQTTFEGFRSD